MAYEKQTWKKGDVITADKLNNIEAGVDNIYQKSYSVTSSVKTAFNGTITTVSQKEGAPGRGPITFDESFDFPRILTVVFNGTPYEVERKLVMNEMIVYGVNPVELSNGDTDGWSEYPFGIAVGPQQGVLYTETAGEYTLTLKETTTEVSTANEFNLAAKASNPIPYDFYFTYDISTSTDNPTFTITGLDVVDVLLDNVRTEKKYKFLSAACVFTDQHKIKYYSIGTISINNGLNFEFVGNAADETIYQELSFTFNLENDGRLVFYDAESETYYFATYDEATRSYSFTKMV